MIRRVFVLVCVLLAPVSTLAQPLPEGAIARLGNHRFSTTWGSGVAVSPDGKMLASTQENSDGKPAGILLWDVATAKVVRETEPGDILSPNSELNLTWSASGKHIGVATRSGFQVFDAETGKCKRPVGNSFDPLIAFRFVAGDRLLAFAGFRYDPRGYFVEIWDVATGKRSASWSLDKSKWESLADGHDIHHVALSPSGETMAWLAGPAPDAKDGSSTVYVYETATEKLLHTLTGLPRAYRVDLPDEGQTLLLHPLRTERVEKVTIGQAAVVSIPTGKVRFHCTYRFGPAVAMHTSGYPSHPGYATRMIVANRDATRFHATLVIPDEMSLTRWDLKTGQKLDEYNEPFENFVVSADGKRLVVRENKRLVVTDGKLSALQNTGVFAKTPLVRFLPDGRLIANDTLFKGGLLHIWEPRKGVLLESIRTYRRPVPSGSDISPIRYDTMGKTTVTTLGNEGRPVIVTYDLTANQAVSVIIKELKRAQLSGDGKRLLTNRFQVGHLIVRWFDARSGQELGRHDIPVEQLHQSLANMPREAVWLAEDGSAFGYIDVNGRVALVDCAQKKVVRAAGITPSKDWGDPVWHPQSAGFDRLLWIAPRFYDIYSGVNHNNKDAAEYAVWDRKGRLLRRFAVPTRNLWQGLEILSPDGRTMAVSVKGNAILLYETASGRPRGVIEAATFGDGLFFESHPDKRLADFSPDATMLAAGCRKTGGVLLWDLARPLGDAGTLPTPENAKDGERLWDLLGHPDPMQSDRALSALAAAPNHAVAVLQQRLKPRPELDAKRVEVLIKQLKSEVFAQRDAANKALVGARETVLPALRAARKQSGSLEEARRIDAVIAELQARLDSPSAVSRELRALQVLERIGTLEARKLVETVANGVDAVPTYEAQLILARWPGRPAK